MNDTPVYKLPDILSAATNDIGLMARRLIEYADLSVVPGLLDALDEVGRYEDARVIRKALGQMACNRNLDWQFFVIRCGGCLWFDMFDLTDSLAKLEARLKPKVMNFSDLIGNRSYTYSDSLVVEPVEAAVPISVGAMVWMTPAGRATNYGTSPPVGRASGDSYTDADGRLMVDVRLNVQPRAVASAMVIDPVIQEAMRASRSSGTPATDPEPGPADPAD